MLVFRSLIQRLTPQGAAAYDPETRARLWLFAGWTSVAVNIVLALLKAVMAFLTGSVSLAADALHSFSDLLTSAVVIIGFRIGKKPADKRHPFGHGRMETISALIVCMDSPFFDDTPAPQ